jgi:hypothetical protein
VAYVPCRVDAGSDWQASWTVPDERKFSLGLGCAWVASRGWWRCGWSRPPHWRLPMVLMPEAPDPYINSRVEDVTLDIAAFESLVGAHGGL